MTKYCLIILFGIFSLAPQAFARDQILVLSGGGSPASNHHSQYLQTRTLAGFLQRRFGTHTVDVYFAVGNNQRSPRIYPDVHAKLKDKGLVIDKMLYGIIPHNKSATKENVLKYFDSPKMKSLGKQDTFFLFVSDHGMPNQKSDYYDNNCIHLWSYDTKELQEGDWNSQCFSTNELKDILTNKIKARRTVFAMSQCYSGGFHQMSVTDQDGYPTANPSICGFTAVTEDLPASGCTDDVSEFDYQGYERYFTQRLTGKNVISGRPMPYAQKRTIRDAHYAAALDDMTIDIPTSTSDYYLQQWYDTIEDNSFKPRSGKLSKDEIRNVMTQITSLKWDENTVLSKAGALRPIIQERLNQIKQTIQAITAYNPKLQGTLENASQTKLTKMMKALDKNIQESNKTYTKLNNKYWKLRYKNLFDPWITAVKNKSVDNLNEYERENFELGFFADHEKDFKGKATVKSYLANEVTLTLADTTNDDPNYAKEFARYKSQRNQIMIDWAQSTGDKNLQNTVSELKEIKAKLNGLNGPLDQMDREYTHLKRILLLRQQLAAAIALKMMNDQIAIDELKHVIVCEKTRF